jgi:hypothetical protein
MDATHPLHGKRLAVATMHGKERVLVPPLSAALGLVAVTPTGFDTDVFGKFTGEIARLGTPLDAARAKARAAMARCGTRLAIASEGTFGPHPAVPLVPFAAELVLLLDDELGLEVIAEDIGTETNFAGIEVHELAAAQEFAARIGFPDHQLVVAVDGVPTATRAGISDAATLRAEVEHRLAEFGRVRVTTDMRADRNPTRMRAIARAAERLAARAMSRCPGCAWPGFGQIDVERGLPCELCGEPTELVAASLHGCARCAERQRRRDADPGNCASCNP